MQTLAQIRQTLELAGLAPRRPLGQHFLIDGNLMGKLLELAELDGGETVLEVGPGTGSLTEELLGRAQRVVAVELDRRLAELLRMRSVPRGNLTVLCRDVLAGKAAIAPEVLAELKGAARAVIVANLPYNVAVPLILDALWSSWLHAKAATSGALPAPSGAPLVRFDRLTVTVQKELLDRLVARPGGSQYGPASVVVALLADATPGRVLPPQAFWPRPKVHSQMLRLDFAPARASELADADALRGVLSTTFQQRRKKISAAARLRHLPFDQRHFLDALAQAGIDSDLRPQQVAPPQFRALANILARLRQ